MRTDRGSGHLVAGACLLICEGGVWPDTPWVDTPLYTTPAPSAQNDRQV